MEPSYRVLGQIAVSAGGSSYTLSRRRERDLLALLVAAHGRAVCVERILDELWADATVVSGPGSVQVAVSRLRALLGPAGSGPRAVERTPAGYRLVAADAEVDAWSFEVSAERALVAPTPADRLVLATAAVERWTGAPYAGCAAASVRAEATRLVELHATVQEIRAEALLDLGHAPAAVRLLAALTPEHPYREGLWALLARAQFACSRQADALSTLATLRTRLVEDLGVDPSPCVRQMEQRILSQDPGLTPSVAPVRRPRAVHARGVRVRHCRARSLTLALHPAG